MGGGSAPQTPDYNKAAAAGVQADLETYPQRYLTEAASKMGGKVTIGGQTYDFTGLGDAQNAAVMSDKMAQTLLNIQQNYGSDYVKQSLADLKQADPKGYASRQQLFDQIMAQADAQPNRPMASDLQTSIMGALQSAGRLDPKELSQVQQSVRGGQVARGNTLGNAATSQEASAAVNASDTLRNQTQATAQGFLQSGVTPEDVQYRRMQQSISNLSNFAQGTTPTSQFRSLSSAGNAAAPFTGTTPNSVVTNPNAAAMGISNALGIYQGNVNWAGQQVNPYMAGLSTGISGVGAATSLGWSPGSGGGGGSAYNPALLGAGGYAVPSY